MGAPSGAPVLVPGKTNPVASATLLIGLNGGGSLNMNEDTTMSTLAPVVPLRPAEPSATVTVPPPNAPIDREQIISELPFILEGALNYLLSDFDYEANLSSNTAVAARILAATIDRLGGAPA